MNFAHQFRNCGGISNRYDEGAISTSGEICVGAGYGFFEFFCDRPLLTKIDIGAGIDDQMNACRLGGSTGGGDAPARRSAAKAAPVSPGGRASCRRPRAGRPAPA